MNFIQIFIIIVAFLFSNLMPFALFSNIASRHNGERKFIYKYLFFINNKYYNIVRYFFYPFCFIFIHLIIIYMIIFNLSLFFNKVYNDVKELIKELK